MRLVPELMLAAATEFLLAEELSGKKLLGALVVSTDALDGEPRSFDLGINAGALVEEVGGIDGRERFAFFHLLARGDMDFSELPADLGLHIDLEGRRHLAGEREHGIDAGPNDLCGRRRLFGFAAPGGKRNPIHPPSHGGENQEKRDEVFDHGA